MQFIVCVIECLRKDHVGCYGYPRPTTPQIDGLATRSVVYRNSRSVSDSALGTFCALATGSADIGALARDPDYPTAPRILAANGIPSYLVSANHIPFAAQLNRWGYTGIVTFMKEEVTNRAQDLGNARVLVEQARSMSGEFYIVLHFKETHAPYTARRCYDEFLPPDDPGPIIEIADRPGRPNSIYRGASIGGERSVGYYVSQYDGAIRYIDEQIGRLIQAFPSAHIVITGDHGEAMGEADRYFCHGYGMFHELIEVPLIYHTPEDAFNVELEPVTHLNIAPTVLDAFGIVPPARYRSPTLPIRSRRTHRIARVERAGTAAGVPDKRGTPPSSPPS
jgi:arylsulfatase A-like enzyme